MALSTASRRGDILHALTEDGRVDVKSLAEGLGVSEATVRRDLRQLAEAGKAELVFGGATLPRTADVSIRSRKQRNADAKRIIGRLAGGLISDHEMLYVDGGTTCFEMRSSLLHKQGLSVILNSWRLAVELGSAEDINIIQIGGHYRPERTDCVGPLAAQSIDQLRGFVAFISADGLSQDFGLWSNDIETAYLYQHVIRNSRDTVLLVDHTKFSAPSLFRIADWGCVSRVVTDRMPNLEWTVFFEDAGIQLVCPETHGAELLESVR